MPREIVHCEIVDRLRDAKLPTLLITHEAFAYLGALGPDAPYYYRLGGTPAEKIAETLHGSEGEDTLILPRELSKYILTLPPDKRDPLWAFVIGYVTHCVVDSIFHPVIYYLTGDYYAGDPAKRAVARRDHRAFEVHLDSWWEHTIGAPHYDLLSYWRTLSGTPAGGTLMTALGEITAGPDDAKIWSDSFWYMATLQRAFRSPIAGCCAKGLIKIAPQLTPNEALFRRGRERGLPEFDLPLTYKNPVSGDEETVTLLDLRKRAIEECISITRAFEPLIGLESNDVEETLGGLRGRSLNAGLAGVKKSEMKFFKE